MQVKDDKLKALSEAIQRGLEESKELQESGALEVRQMEENVRSNISAIGDILKAELSKKQFKSSKPIESLNESPKEETVASDDSLKSKILELGSILHSALSTAKLKPIAEEVQISEPQLILEPVEDPIAEAIVDFDEEKAQENISSSFAKIADLLKKELTPEQKLDEPRSIEQPSIKISEPEATKTPTKNSIINNYVNILDKISKDTPVEAERNTTTESELSPTILKYINEQVTALRVQIGHAMESGGGSVAQQFANGGTMTGNLNVTGQILSGGVDLSTIFTGSSGSYLPLTGGTLTGPLSSTSTIAVSGGTSNNWNYAYSQATTYASFLSSLQLCIGFI